MKHIHLLLFLTLLLASNLLSGCSSHEDLQSHAADSDTQQVLDQGALNFDANHTQFTFHLKNTGQPWSAKLQGASGAATSWCDVSIEEYDQTTDVTLHTRSNPSLNRRNIVLLLSNGDQRKQINITQKANPRMYADRNHMDALAEGGDVYVQLHTNVLPRVDLQKTAPWLHFVDMQRIDRHPDANKDSLLLAFHFTTDANTDLGRLTTVAFANDSAGSTEVTIHQWGRKLKSTERIHLAEPGLLWTLIGGNGHDWTGLDSLILSGQINTADMQAIRTLLCPYIRVALTNPWGNLTVDTECYLHLRHLDLSQCSIVGGGNDYTESSIHTNLPDTYLNDQSNTLADCAFKITRTHLESIILPQNLVSIGGWAFYFCDHLRRIDLPATVRNIGAYAFANCTSLAEFNIPNTSQLEHLGVYALNSGSNISEIRLPSSLKIDESEGPILGSASTQNIHLSWPVPPVLKKYGVGKKTIIYVPQGSGDAYRAAQGWNRAQEIIEE